MLFRSERACPSRGVVVQVYIGIGLISDEDGEDGGRLQFSNLEKPQHPVDTFPGAASTLDPSP